MELKKILNRKFVPLYFVLIQFLGFFVKWYINLRGLFNAKAINVKEHLEI